MTNLTDLTITEALAGLAAKKFSALELTKAHIAAMESARHLNAFITETPDHALKQAAESDARIAKGQMGKLEGIPIGQKDLFCTKGIQTTSGSRILKGFIPTYESTVSQKLLDAGSVMLGKTNMDEFALGSSTTMGAYGSTVSPWKRNNDDNVDLVAGGTSGGSAAAVSARLCMGATGTDTGGSIRQPAAFTGTVGIRATYGRCSRWGIIAAASSLDQAGTFARTVEDAALMLEVMSGHDPKDSTSADITVPDFRAAMTGDIRGLRIGIPKEYRMDGMPAEIEKFWQDGIAWMKDAGAIIIDDISLPHTKYALPAYYIVNPAEVSSNLARYDGVRYGQRIEGKNLNDMYELTRAAGFNAEVKRRIMIGTYVLSAGYYDAYYTKAQKIRRLIANDFKTAFEKCDALLTPTTPSAAFAIGENEDDPIKMYLNDIFTVTVNMAGLPGMSVPCGLSSDGLPLGLQIIGKPWDEATIFRVGGVLEKAANFTAKPQSILKKAA